MDFRAQRLGLSAVILSERYIFIAATFCSIISSNKSAEFFLQQMSLLTALVQASVIAHLGNSNNAFTYFPTSSLHTLKMISCNTTRMIFLICQSNYVITQRKKIGPWRLLSVNLRICMLIFKHISMTRITPAFID